MNVYKKGWLPFNVFLLLYGIKRDGNQYKKLKDLDACSKFNTSTGDKQARWMVEEKAACTLWGKVMLNEN